ncbi:Hypothetical predicted protein, partial [Mytilus galloprovincialis]
MQIDLQSAGCVRGCAILPNGEMIFCDYNNGSGAGSNVIHIIDSNSRTIKRTIQSSKYPYGIALNENVLVYCKSGKGIMEVQMNGESEKTLVRLNMPLYS